MENLKGVANTLYLPMVARIYVSRHFPEYFCDQKALSLANSLPAGVEQGSDEYTHMAHVDRCWQMDHTVQSFILSHPGCNIIYLGVGLDTGFDRVPHGAEHFYGIDLPEAIALRKQVLGEREGETLIAGDMFAMGWVSSIDKTLPTLIVVSGVFQYFHIEQVQRFIGQLKQSFPQGELVFDATNSTGLKFTNKFVQRSGNTASLMYFYVDDANLFAQQTGTHLLSEKMFHTQARHILRGKLKFRTRLFMFGCDLLKRAKIIHLQLR